MGSAPSKDESDSDEEAILDPSELTWPSCPGAIDNFKFECNTNRSSSDSKSSSLT